MSREPNTHSPTRVNFLPEWYRRRHRGQRLVLGQAMMLVGLLIIGGWLIGRELHHGTTLEEKRTDLRQQLQATRRNTPDPAELRSTHRELTQSLRAKRHLHRPIGYAEITATLVDLVPESVALRRLRIEVTRQTARPDSKQNPKNTGNGDRKGDSPKASARPRRVVTIRIEGIGPSDAEVSRFTGALASNELFSDVEIGYWRQATHDGLHVRRFEVRTTVPLDRRYQPPAAKPKPTEVTGAG